MTTNNLEKMIPKRKSVRAIDSSPLDETLVSEILAFAQNVTPLFPEIRTVLRVLPQAEIKGLGSVFAPHYLVLYSERSPDADLNSGFILQQMDLYLSSLGIGSCWLGMTKPSQLECEGVPFVILLAFGKPGEPVHRTSRNEFKRKDLSEMGSTGAIPAYIDDVRLAPSAMNKQPWYFTGDERNCHAFSVRGRGLINIAEGWRFVDLGISLAHLYLAATADGKKVTFRREDSIPSGNENEYVISCRME